jgi:hypothetical protein
MSKSFDKKEVEELVEILMDYYPSAKKTIDVLLEIHKWAKKLNYPVNSFSDLARQVQKNPITIDDKEVDFANIKAVMPAYYFPIASFENLIEKAHEIIKLRQQQPALMTRPPIPGVGPEFMPVQPSPPSPEFMPVQPSPPSPEFMPVQPSPPGPFTAAGSQIPPSRRPPSMPT